MTGFNLRAPSKAQLATLSWELAFRGCMVLNLAWVADMLLGPAADPLGALAVAIIVVALVDIAALLWRHLRAQRPNRRA